MKILLKLFSQIIFAVGLITSLIIIILLIYYFNSGMYERYKAPFLLKKINDKIIYKYFGFDFYKLDKYFNQNIKSLKYLISDNDLETVNINIDFNNYNNLELQRLIKLNKDLEINSIKDFSKAKIQHNGEEYKIRLRVKGDRVLHWYKKNETSYKIDLRNRDKIWGLEEFSIQKPITRNYIYELIFHKMLEDHNLISLKYFFINLSINNVNRGIYAVEEGFSKELLKRNKRKNGPIYGLNEKMGVIYPKIEYDLYSKNYWLKKAPDTIDISLSNLNKVKINELHLNQIFDIEKWATYFAIIDLTGNFHGSITKSVKLYYNPESKKYEPVGFDGHYNPDLFQNFLIIDFLDNNNLNCDYICNEKSWYQKFLLLDNGKLNDEFIKLYLQKLKTISSIKFVENFISENKETINFYNNQFLSELSKKDKVLYKGLGFYIYDEDYLLERSKYIQKRLKEIENLLISKA
jgi:hypothetical protein